MSLNIFGAFLWTIARTPQHAASTSPRSNREGTQLLPFSFLKTSLPSFDFCNCDFLSTLVQLVGAKPKGGL